MQTFLQRIALARKEKNFLVPKDVEASFVKLLLNRNVTEFDMVKFNDQVVNFDQEYFDHLEENCPSIRQIRFVCDEIKDEDEIQLPSPLKMKQSWPNLTYLSLRGVSFCDEELRELRLHIPQLK